MSVVTVADAQHVARLARVHLSEDELRQFVPQLDEILTYVHQLQRVPTDGVEPTHHVLPLANIMRPDQLTPTDVQEAVLHGAPARHGQLFQVPKVVEATL